MAILADKPQAYWYPSIKEQPVGHRHNAVDQVRLDELAANVSLAAGLAPQRTVRKDEASGPLWRQMINKVLDPGEVGVTLRWRTVPPTWIVRELGRAASPSFLSPPSLQHIISQHTDITRKGGFAITKSARRSGCKSFAKESSE